MDVATLNRLLAKGAEVLAGSGIRQATIQSVGDLVRIVECEHLGSYQYRGQRCIDWPLLPTLTRSDSPCNTGLEGTESCRDKELHILNEFRTRQRAYRAAVPDNELAAAIVAQHHGAPTRLLDWSMNPLAALYFAVEEDPLNDKDGVVWASDGHRYRVPDLQGCTFHKLGDGIFFVIPDHDENRAAVQASLFAVWRDLDRQFDEVALSNKLWKISIPRKKFAPLRWALHCLGLNRETLFPDLDGLGRYLSWKHKRIHQTDYLANGVPEPR